jgi:hypothetical protein
MRFERARSMAAEFLGPFASSILETYISLRPTRLAVLSFSA